MYTLIKRSVASLSGPGLLNEIPNFLFYKTLRGLGLPLMVKVFVILSVNFSEIQHAHGFRIQGYPLGNFDFLVFRNDLKCCILSSASICSFYTNFGDNTNEFVNAGASTALRSIKLPAPYKQRNHQPSILKNNPQKLKDRRTRILVNEVLLSQPSFSPSNNLK